MPSPVLKRARSANFGNDLMAASPSYAAKRVKSLKLLRGLG